MNREAWRDRASATRSRKRDESVVGPGHDHAVFAGLFDLVAQHQAEFEDDGLLHLARSPPCVPLSMPPCPGSITRSGRGSLALRLPGCGSYRAVSGARFSSAISAHERLAIHRGEIEHEPRRLIVAASSTKALSIRAGRARSMTMREPPGITRPKRNALIRPRPRLPGLRPELERDLRHVDHHPVRVGQREGADIHLLAEIHHHSRLTVVPAQADVAGDWKSLVTARDRARRARALGG